MALDRVVEGYLKAAEEEIDAARRLMRPPPNRLAAYHLQQAAEKLTKAVLVDRGQHPGREHRISVLLARLEAADPWRARLEPLDHLSAYATAYRYPGTSGRLRRAPDAPKLAGDADAVDALIRQARSDLGEQSA